MIDSHDLGAHVAQVDASRLFYCQHVMYCHRFEPKMNIDGNIYTCCSRNRYIIYLNNPILFVLKNVELFFPLGSDTCKERWLHVKYEEQEQMLMDKLCPPKALN